MDRRHFLAGSAALAWAQAYGETGTSRPPLTLDKLPPPGAGKGTEAFVLGVETVMVENGFADYIRKALARDVGLGVEIVSGPSVDLLDRLEAGTLAAALTNAPNREATLDKKGLIIGYRPVVVSNNVLLGPPKDPAQIKGMTDLAQAYARIVEFGNQTATQVQTGQPDGCGYVAQGENSGTRDTELGLFKPAGTKAAGVWLRTAPAGALSAIKLASQWPVGGAYTLAEQSVLARAGKIPLKPVIDNIRTTYTIARSFRYTHPAANMLMGWLVTTTGKQAINGFKRGYHTPT
jgi:tungstate transport system substrate-binding protein